ncbi:RNA exonuclease 1 homolog isoform X2 [Alosa pseudoharengus]|uniref:RNA exonuclease 1 homolog isoform X2 n=1 Tax=Alosa pseudoharengus TaxID=34774 RepID=UPI003F891124
MLRSTGFFRGIDCPFYSESYNGKIVKNGCNRPYCHFRHSNQRRTSYGAFEVRKTKELSSSTNEECYDPFSPEVVRPEDHRNEEPETKRRPGSPMDVGAIELELVNRAIEAVQCEVEKERRKLSHIGDQEYEPSSSSSTVGPKRKKPVPVASHQGYDPGSYQMTQGTDYSPTPRSNKYVLDSESEDNHGSSMEYVPTAVSKTSAKKSLLFSPTSHTSKLPSSPQSSSSAKCKYTLHTSKSPLDSESEENHSSSLEYVPTAVSKTSSKKSLLFSPTSRTSNLPSSPKRSTSVKNKYTLDKSKPLTDMEYDPLSNFSAKLASKNKYQRALTTDAETKKAFPPTSKRKQSIDEEYVPTVKKPRPQQPVVDSQKYSAYFAESDEESSGTEYRPMLLSHLQRRKNASASAEDATRRSSEEKGDAAPSSRVLKQQRSQNSKPEEVSSQGDSGDPEESLDRERSREKVPEKKAKDRDSQKKSSKNGDTRREEKRPSGKSSGEKVRTGSSSSDKKKKLSSESINKTERTDDKNRLKDKVAHKSRKEEKSTDGKSRRPEKVKGESSHKEKERSSEVKMHKPEKTHERDLSKYKDQKNGKLHSAGKEKDKTKSSQGSVSVSKDKSRKSGSSSGGKEAKVGRQKQRSLSHVDLFGDESGEDARQKEKDDEDDEDEEDEEEIIVRKSAAAHRRKGLLSSKKDAVDLRRSFSEEEIGQEDDRSDNEDVDDGGVDYSNLQDVDYDSDPDPLEECLRIFNESKDVKTEDKGRQAKQSSSMKRPVIPTEFGAKVPTGVRQRYLNLFIDECLKVCPSEPAAFQMALDEEKVVYDRSSSKNIYLNVAVNTLKKLRSKSTLPASNPPKYQAASASQKIQSHEKMLGGRMAAKTSFTVNRMGKQQELELRGACLYAKLKEYLMTEEQLQEHGYPRPNPDRPGHVIIHNAPEKKNLDPFSKVCCRCGAEYKINVNGSCVRKEECSHHWGRLRRYRVSGGWETHYNCCSGAVGSLGCQVAKQHVQDGRKEAVEGYVKTFNKPLPSDGDAGVFALDCEMCYTKQGLELTRVTVINSELKVIYDTFVKPESKVVDYNTRFSGVTEEDLESCSITMRDVQAVLLSMFSADSILIGHSLESDLTALKLVHSTVVDTAIVFPHRLGLPYKRALRNLMADYLKRIIQDNVEGHDSSEDACACMELMMWKIKEDAKVKR